jgi:hypothetical protein
MVLKLGGILDRWWKVEWKSEVLIEIVFELGGILLNSRKEVLVAVVQLKFQYYCLPSNNSRGHLVNFKR